MADPVEIAKLRERSLTRITDAATSLSNALGIDPPAMRQHANDRTYLEADRLATLAEWLEQVDAAFTAPPVADPEPMLPLDVNASDEAGTGVSNAKNNPRPQRKPAVRSRRNTGNSKR